MRCTNGGYRERQATLDWLFLVMIAAWLLSAKAWAGPVYTDTLQLSVSVPSSTDDEVQVRADQVRKLTTYIEETYRIDRSKAVAIVTEAVYNGSKHDVRPELILAIIAVESSYQEKAVSRAGARGLMQIMPRAHPDKVRAIGGVKALFDPKKNISTGVKILNEYLSRSEGNLSKALLRYNGSLSDSKARYSRRVMTFYNKFKKITDRS